MSFLPWLCYTAFRVDTNISASFGCWWFRGLVQTGKGVQVPCSTLHLFLHTVTIAETEHSFCSMFLLPKKELRGNEAKTPPSKISYQAAGWQGDGAHRRGRGGTCPPHICFYRRNVALGTWCPDSTSSPTLKPFAKQSWRNKEGSDSYSASLPLFWWINVPKL